MTNNQGGKKKLTFLFSGVSEIGFSLFDFVGDSGTTSAFLPFAFCSLSARSGVRFRRILFDCEAMFVFAIVTF